jgi:hypothetical protein
MKQKPLLLPIDQLTCTGGLVGGNMDIVDVSILLEDFFQA